VSVEKPSPEPQLDQISERLTVGIECCRSVVANYKTLLTDNQAANPSDAPDDTGAHFDSLTSAND
jgi:hypothetical protein